MKNILVVGGGTAGLITAIILKKRLNVEIDIVHSKNIGIIGVGEGSTEHFNEFMKLIGVDSHTIIRECDATLKAGIMFEGWGSKSYLHSVQQPYDKHRYAQYGYVYGKLISNNSQYINSELTWESKVEKKYAESNEYPAYNQYHFNTFKLNEFLVKIAKDLGINIFEDEINGVIVEESGFIDYLIGSHKNYKYDFYIDSTGFKRLLIEKLGAKWISFGKQLKMKSAITFQTPDEENYNLWTLSKAMDYGWLFRIPVWGRYGNGYIFDSDYIDEAQAKAEVEKLYGKELEIGKKFNFDPGALDRVWINNCVAIGLSGSFVEPLEASSIGTSIQQAFLLMHRLPNYNQEVIDSYNKSVEDILVNIRDFLMLHYFTKKENSIFWQDLRHTEIPESLLSKLILWQTRLPIHEDFSEYSDYILFKDSNFLHILHGLDLFNLDSIKNEYNFLKPEIKELADKAIEETTKYYSMAKTYTHKEFIEVIRNKK